MSDNPMSQSARDTPHIRLNSGQHDPFSDPDENGPPVPSHGGIGRALTPGMSNSTSTGTFLTMQTGMGSPTPQDSTDFLLPPRPQRHREQYDGFQSPDLSGQSSRRTSWSSEGGSESRGYFYPRYEDMRSPSYGEGDGDDVNTQTVTEKFNIMPSEGLLLFPEDVEKDDYLHNPDPNDKERDCDIWNRRGIVNGGGLVLLTLGLLMLFIGYPVLYDIYPYLDNYWRGN